MVVAYDSGLVPPGRATSEIALVFIHVYPFDRIVPFTYDYCTRDTCTVQLPYCLQNSSFNYCNRGVENERMSNPYIF